MPPERVPDHGRPIEIHLHRDRGEVGRARRPSSTVPSPERPCPRRSMVITRCRGRSARASVVSVARLPPAPCRSSSGGVVASEVADGDRQLAGVDQAVVDHGFLLLADRAQAVTDRPGRHAAVRMPRQPSAADQVVHALPADPEHRAGGRVGHRLRGRMTDPAGHRRARAVSATSPPAGRRRGHPDRATRSAGPRRAPRRRRRRPASRPPTTRPGSGPAGASRPPPRRRPAAARADRAAGCRAAARSAPPTPRDRPPDQPTAT